MLATKVIMLTPTKAIRLLKKSRGGKSILGDWRTGSKTAKCAAASATAPLVKATILADRVSVGPGLAVSNAVGAWLYEYPVTPDRVLKAIGKTGSRIGGAK